MLYLDYAASAPLCVDAKKNILRGLDTDFANPSSSHRFGKKILKNIEQAREIFAGLLGTNEQDRLIFTSSATESNNTLIRGLTYLKGQEILLTHSDHPSLVVPATFEAAKNRCTIKPIQLNANGLVDLEKFSDSLSGVTRLVCLAHVNNLDGSIRPIKEMKAAMKRTCPQAHLHVDAVQSFGRIPVKVDELGADSLSLSSHKVGGPKGAALLYLRAGVEIEALLMGGGQEAGMRSSTYNGTAITSFGQAAKWICAQKFDGELLPALAEELLKLHPNIALPFTLEQRAPHILLFLFRGLSSDIIIRHLEQQEIYLSSSSACSSRIQGVNPSFEAMGLERKDHKFPLRLSIGCDTTRQDLKIFLQAFSKVIAELRAFI